MIAAVVDGAMAGGTHAHGVLPATNAIHDPRRIHMTKAEEVFTKVEELIASGSSKADAFKKLASEYGQPVDSIRGSYYRATQKSGNDARRCACSRPGDTRRRDRDDRPRGHRSRGPGEGSPGRVRRPA